MKIFIWRKSKCVKQAECNTAVEFIPNFSLETGNKGTCGKTRSRWADNIKICSGNIV